MFNYCFRPILLVKLNFVKKVLDFIKKMVYSANKFDEQCFFLEKKDMAKKEVNDMNSEKEEASKSAGKTEMTVKEALYILLNSDRLDPNYAKALAVVKRDDAAYAEYQKFIEAQQKEKEEFSIVSRIEEIADTYASNKERLQVFSNEYKVNIYGKRTRNVKGQADAKDKTPSHWSYLKGVVDFYSIDEEGKTVVDDKGNPALVSPEEKNEWMSLVFREAKDAAYIELLKDEQYAKLSDEEAMRLFRDKVDENVQENLANAVVATEVKLPEDSNVQVGSQEFFEHVNKQSDKANKKLGDFLTALQGIDAEEIEARDEDKTKEKRESIKEIYANKRDAVVKKYKDQFRINPAMILFGTAHLAAAQEDVAKEFLKAATEAEKRGEKATSEKVKAKYGEIKEKFEKTGKYIYDRIAGLEKTAEKTSKGSYFRLVKPNIAKIAKATKEAAKVAKDAAKDIAKGSVEAFKINRGQTVVDLVATMGLSASGFSAVALGAYGGFMIARGWVAPIWAEAKKMKLESKKEGKKPLSFIKRVGLARAKMKDNEKYQRKGWTTTAISGIIFGGLATAAVLSGGVLPVLGAAALMPVIKAGLSVLVQGNETAHAYAAYRKDKENENLKKAYKAERRGLFAGIVLSAATQAFMHSDLAEKMRDVIHDAFGKIYDAFGKGDVTPVADASNGVVPPSGAAVDTLTTPADTTGLTGAAPIEDVAVPEPIFDDDALAPKAWSKDMGVTKSEYLEEMRKDNNVDEYFKYYHYKLHSENVMPRNAYEHAWMKLSQDGIMDRFPEGTTKEQVITQYFAMFGHFRRNVDLVAGAASLPKDAFWEHSEEMNQMYQFLFCDERAVNVDDKTIAHIMNAKEFMLEHSDPNNHNVITEFNQDCHNVGKGSKWAGLVEKPIEEPKLPVIDDEMDIVDDDIVIEDDNIKFDDKSLNVELMEKKVVQEPEQYGREYVSEHNSDDYQHVKGEKILTNEEVNKAHRFHRKVSGGRE